MQAVIAAGTMAILALLVALGVQLWLYLPRTWRTAPFGQILGYTVAALVGWLVSWLTLALGLWGARVWWGVRPRPWAVLIINFGLLGSLIVILALSNAALWRWRRRGWARAAERREGGIPDDDD